MGGSNAQYIRFMQTRDWVKHEIPADPNTVIELAEGYELMALSTFQYTFTGMPAAQIRYDDEVYQGFDPTMDIMTTSATVTGDDAVLDAFCGHG